MAWKPMPFDKVEAMFLAYCKKPSAENVASTCGVSWHTAKKYIEEGDPKRGILPFRRRVKRVARLVARQTEERVAYSRAVALAATWDHLERFDDIIDQAMEKLAEKLTATPAVDAQLRVTDVAKALEIASKVKRDVSSTLKTTREVSVEISDVSGNGPESALGYPPQGAGAPGDTVIQEGEFKGWTMDQVRGFLGELPAAAQMSPTAGALGPDGQPDPNHPEVVNQLPPGAQHQPQDNPASTQNTPGDQETTGDGTGPQVSQNVSGRSGTVGQVREDGDGVTSGPPSPPIGPSPSGSPSPAEEELLAAADQAVGEVDAADVDWGFPTVERDGPPLEEDQDEDQDHGTPEV